jgi:hypothetical protein
VPSRVEVDSKVGGVEELKEVEVEVLNGTKWI